MIYTHFCMYITFNLHCIFYKLDKYNMFYLYMIYTYIYDIYIIIYKSNFGHCSDPWAPVAP